MPRRFFSSAMARRPGIASSASRVISTSRWPKRASSRHKSWPHGSHATRVTVQLDAIYSSDLMRAQRAAQPFADALGLAPRRGRAARTLVRPVSGHDSAEIETLFPDAYAAATDATRLRAGGRRVAARVHHRVLHALEPIVAEHPGGRIACVAHGGVLDCVYRFANGIELSAPRNYQLLNTSINVVDYVDGRAQVVRGPTCHLDAASDDDGYRKVL